MKYKLVIFDMDGTILNTLEDLADSMNHCLPHFGMPTRSLDEIRRFIGNGVHKLAERAGGDFERLGGMIISLLFRDKYYIIKMSTATNG